MKFVAVLIVLVALAGNLFVASADEGEEVQNPIVECSTTKGFLAIEVHREWAPLGADRFLELVKDSFYTNIALFRCVHKFLVQFGISEDPTKKHWHNKNLKDDPNIHIGVKKNYVSFAGGGPNTRSTQLFIAFEDLDFLGNEPWETPFGKCIRR
jgi:cyclophilin family peptidyl-prolyl cis-trans isomerase